MPRATMGAAASWAAVKRLTPSSSSSVLVLFLLLLVSVKEAVDAAGTNLTFNGFSGDAGTSLALDGLAAITSSGILQLTNNTRQSMGHAFYRDPFNFKQPAAAASGNGTGPVLSFSTTFVFAIVTEFPNVLSGHGIAFVVSPTRDLSTAQASQYLGLFNEANNGNATNHVLAVELDTLQMAEFKDIDNNHVGVDMNSVISNVSQTAGWYSGDTDSSFQNLSLISGDPMQVWVDYNSTAARLDVTMAPLGKPKPRRPLLSTAALNLSEVLLDSMYVGFTSSTGSVLSSHYILGWSFAVGGSGEAPPLDLSKLPLVPRRKAGSSGRLSKAASALVALGTAAAVLGVIAAVVLVLRRRQKFAEEWEDWEKDYGPRRFKYQDLYMAANGFKDKDLLGRGGFGRVYKGLLPATNIPDGSSDSSMKVEVAIKRVSHDSRQGIREFVAEIASMGQLRHRNLVQLLGYCRRKGEMLLVYEYMPNGSLDKFLYPDGATGGNAASSTAPPVLDWPTRFHIIKGVASGLVYLHEDWDKVVVHRDIKASNILLDEEMNGRLSDFGLARLYDHGGDARTTRVVGTMGYLAPEIYRTRRPTTATDAYAFGAFALEVVSGRRPIELAGDDGEDRLLLDWVAEKWKEGRVSEAVDPRLRGDYVVDEVELVLKMGMLCSHPSPTARPSMRQVVQFLYGAVPLPDLSTNYMDAAAVAVLRKERFDASAVSGSSSTFSAGSDQWLTFSGGR